MVDDGQCWARRCAKALAKVRLVLGGAREKLMRGDCAGARGELAEALRGLEAVVNLLTGVSR